MSAKKGDLNLLIPGADGWEIWTGSNASGYQLHSATGHLLALDVTGFPSGSVGMAIPVRQVSAVPFRAQTDDLALLGDLAAMQLEKNGTRPALDGGQLTDHFVFGTSPEETHLTAVVMNPPSEGQLPRRSPEAFDISPRCLPLAVGKVVVWRELGRWIFGIGKPGQALYFQCLSGEYLDDRAGNEVRLAMTQLQIQGLLKEPPDSVVVWTHDSATDARSEEIEAFARGIGISLQPSLLLILALSPISTSIYKRLKARRRLPREMPVVFRVRLNSCWRTKRNGTSCVLSWKMNFNPLRFS
jgi:hypothetical protein